MPFAGVDQASVAWPDRQAQRYIVDDMARNGVEEVTALTHLPSAERSPGTISFDGKAVVSVEAGQKLVIRSESVEVAAPLVLPTEPLTEDEYKALTSQTPTGDYESKAEPISEAQAIRNYFADHGTGQPNKAVIAALKEKGINVTSSQVSRFKATFAAEQEAAQ